MKKIILLFVLLTSLTTFGQKNESKFYYYNGEPIRYTRIDYSEYGIGQIYVTAYTDTEKNRFIQLEAIKYLNSLNRLYHTLYFFIVFPEKYSFEEKEIIFNQIMKEIETQEKLKNFNLLLNFDIDYSDKYQTEVLENNKENKVKRVFIGITPKKIKNALTSNIKF